MFITDRQTNPEIHMPTSTQTAMTSSIGQTRTDTNNLCIYGAKTIYTRSYRRPCDYGYTFAPKTHCHLTRHKFARQLHSAYSALSGVVVWISLLCKCSKVHANQTSIQPIQKETPNRTKPTYLCLFESDWIFYYLSWSPQKTCQTILTHTTITSMSMMKERSMKLLHVQSFNK